MEVSKFSATSRGDFSLESLLLKKKRNFKLHQYHQFNLPIQSIRSNTTTTTTTTAALLTAQQQNLLAPTGFLNPPKKKNFFKVLSSHNEGTPVLEARSINEIYDALAERLLPTPSMASNLDAKYIVGLAGPPGSGKSTIAYEVTRRINTKWSQKAAATDAIDPPDYAIVLPMDGFHLYRHQLDQMENPEEAHARRGAPWTFDPVRLLNCLKTLRNEGSVYVPSFDHGVGDPVEDDIFVNLQHKLVIVEGNYLLLDEGVWPEIASVFDEKWFIEVDIDTAMKRVLKRHISTGKPPDIAQWRIDYNDRPNAELITKSKKNANMVIKSVDFNS